MKHLKSYGQARLKKISLNKTAKRGRPMEPMRKAVVEGAETRSSLRQELGRGLLRLLLRLLLGAAEGGGPGCGSAGAAERWGRRAGCADGRQLLGSGSGRGSPLV